MEELITFEFLAIFAQCDPWYFLPRWDFLKSPFFSYHVIVRLCQSNPDNSTDEVRTVLVTLQCLPQDGCLWFYSLVLVLEHPIKTFWNESCYLPKTTVLFQMHLLTVFHPVLPNLSAANDQNNDQRN